MLVFRALIALRTSEASHDKEHSSGSEKLVGPWLGNVGGAKHVAKWLFSMVAFSSDVETEWLASDKVWGILEELLDR